MPIEIRLPALAPDFEAGTIEHWHEAVGDEIEVGDVIADIETDKAVVEIEAVDSGMLGKIVVEAGTADVPVNSVIGLLLLEGESAKDLEGPYVSAPPDAAPAVTHDDTPSPTSAPSLETQTAPGRNDRVIASPMARRIARQSGVDLRTIKGRGPKGRILRADVEAAASALSDQQAPARPAPSDVADKAAGEAYTAIPNSSMRKVIARRLGESKRDVPHFYLTIDCELDALLAIRKQYNAESPEGAGAYKLSVNDFVVKACALALRDVPAANVSWTEEAIHQYHDVDISVAVATPRGLITPIVRAADRKSMIAISAEVKDLAQRARDGKLKPVEYQGGGFSISTLGMFGIQHFSAIVNPPQSCILAVGAGEQRPTVKDGRLGIATLMSCTLSVDHRSVDGALGAAFLQAFKKYIEQPLSLLLRSAGQ